MVDPLGALLAPYAATLLATNRGLDYVGYYLSLALLALLCINEDRPEPEVPAPLREKLVATR